jgi:polar amino acid transport system substrate-binding protein
MRHLLILLLSGITFLSFSNYSAESLEIAAEDEASPWAQKDGTGYANDVVKAAFKAVDVDVKFQVMPYARCKHMVIEGEIAGCFSVSPMKELEKSVQFADKPLFVCFSDYFQNPNKPVNATTQDEIPKGTVVGTVTGYEYPEALFKLKEKGIVVFEEVDSEELNFKKLADGRIALTLLNYNQMKPPGILIAKVGATGKIVRAFRCGTLDSFIAFSRKHPKGAWACEKFNEGFKTIAANGTLLEIERKWADKAIAELKQVEAANGSKAPAPNAPALPPKEEKPK